MALRLSPDDYLVLLKRGTLLKERGSFDAALADFNRAIELRPNYPEGYTERAEAYFRLNQKERAETDLATANKLLRSATPLRIQSIGRMPLMPGVPEWSTPNL